MESFSLTFQNAVGMPNSKLFSRLGEPGIFLTEWRRTSDSDGYRSYAPSLLDPLGALHARPLGQPIS